MATLEEFALDLPANFREQLERIGYNKSEEVENINQAMSRFMAEQEYFDNIEEWDALARRFMTEEYRPFIVCYRKAEDRICDAELDALDPVHAIEKLESVMGVPRELVIYVCDRTSKFPAMYIKESIVCRP